jgi:hypothetical protein
METVWKNKSWKIPEVPPLDPTDFRDDGTGRGVHSGHEIVSDEILFDYPFPFRHINSVNPDTLDFWAPEKYQKGILAANASGFPEKTLGWYEEMLRGYSDRPELEIIQVSRRTRKNGQVEHFLHFWYRI